MRRGNLAAPFLLRRRRLVPWESMDPRGFKGTSERGPGNFKILDLGGTGDCGYRCVAYGIAFWNHKEFKGKIAEEAQFRSKIVEIGAVLKGTGGEQTSD